MKRKIGGIALASMIAALLCTPVVLADEPQTPAAGSSSGTEPAASAGAPTPSGEAPAPAASSQPDVAPGPLEADRKVLLGHIQQAGAHGIGIANYMMAFNAIEDQVRHGAGETQLKPRVEQLNSALLEQLKRAQILKTQRPLPPTTSQQADASGPAPAAPAAPAPAGAASPLGNLGGLTDKLGGLNIPDSLKERLLKSDQAKEILKRLGQ